MGKKDTRRKYTKEFKVKVVKEHLEGASLTELSRMYGIAPSTIGTWFATLKAEVEQEVKEEEINVIIDPEAWEEMEKLRTRNIELEKELKEKDKVIEGLLKKVERLPENVEEVSSWKDKVEELSIENTKLEDEIKRLHGLLSVVKEEARKEVNTLKEAIMILAKPTEE